MKPILMNPSDTLTQMTSSQTNGLGRLNAQRCVVTEERNGIYEAELTVFIDDEHFSSLSVGSVLKLMTNEGLQMFRVYQITKPINGVCSVYAHHITYDLAKAPVMPFTATGATNVVNGLVSHMASTYEFTMITDIVNALSVFTLTEPKYFRECLGGYQGSVLDVFGGEYEWDNTTVKLLAHRGSDNGVQIRYGKNLTDIQQETNIESMYDAVIGYATVNDITTTGTVQMITQVSSPKTMIVDFSDEFDDDETVTVEKLNTLALNYIQTHDMTAPRVSIDVSFVALASADQYKDIAPLEHVKLCDTVHVLFEKLGVNASAKVIKTTYDSLNERLLSVEIGDAKSTMTDVINGTVADAEAEQTRAVNAVDGAVGNLTNMILNSLGLFVSKVEKSGGGYQYYMHNRPELSDSQYQWTINAGGFAVSQDYGQTWTAGIDSDGNAVFNSISANSVDAMSITGSEITGGLITGTEIDSGDMYWFKGTANQGLMHEATWSWSSTNHTGVELLSGAWRLNTGNAYHIMYDDFIQFRVGNNIGKNTLTISDRYISLFQNVNGSTLQLGDSSSYMSYGNYGMVMVNSNGVTMRTRTESSSMGQHRVIWKEVNINGTYVTVLAAAY